MRTDLGDLSRVDVREIWTHEALDFTPWLAEHIDVLGDLLGVELEVRAKEHAIGDFSLDILAHDLGRDRVVIVENQLAPTDHSHLGQVLTYAAGVGAQVVVWISPEFRDEHRQALDWLNQGHGTGTEFFGVVLEALRIDQSRPAINLRLVASPKQWSPGGGGGGEPTQKGAAYQGFFQALIDELREQHRFTNAKAGQPQNWYSFSSGTRGFTYGMSFAQTGELRAEIYIDVGDGEKNKAAFDALLAEKQSIEKAFGEALTWERLDSKRACRIACYTTGSIEDSADQLEQHRRWAVERLLRLKATFGPRLSSVVVKGA